MKRCVLFLLFVASSVIGSDLPHIGYVYPAGGTPGSSFTVEIGGQYLEDFAGIHISGGGITAKKKDFKREPDQRAANRLKNSMEKMEAMLAEDPDKEVREQLLYQMKQAEKEMDMVKMFRQEKRKNPGLYRKKQFNPQLMDTLTLVVTLESSVTPGMHELRLITTNGLSNHLLFQVSELPEITESNPGDVPELPLALNGQILPGEVDTFRFYARSGRDLVFRVLARSLVPYLADAVPGWFQAVLTLYDTNGNEIAYMDDFRFDPDPVLICQVPTDGEYVLEIRDAIYRGRRDFVYRIEMGELPFIDHIFPLGAEAGKQIDVQLYGVNLPENKITVDAGGNAPEFRSLFLQDGEFLSNKRPFLVDTAVSVMEEEPNNTPFQAQMLILPVAVDGRIGRAGDFDCFRFKGQKGEAVSIEVFARRLDSPVDARLVLLGPEEHILEVNDDKVDRGEGLITHHADSVLQYTLTADGIYTIRLDDLQGKGGAEYAYRLKVGPETPDYVLRIVPSSLTIPQDGSAIVTVHAIRKGGFDGPIALKIKGRSNGLEMGAAVVPAGCESMKINLTAKDRDKGELMVLKMEGEARINKHRVKRPAVPADDMMQAFLWRHLVVAKELLVRVTDPDPVGVHLTLPKEGVVHVRAGRKFEIAAEVLSREIKKGWIRVEIADPPDWISLVSKGVKIGGNASPCLVFEVKDDVPEGTYETLVLNGIVSVMKKNDDPTYNPIMKWKNRTKYEFTIGAVPVKIDD